MAESSGGGCEGLPIPSGWADCDVFDENIDDDDGGREQEDQQQAKVASASTVGGTPQKKRKGGAPVVLSSSQSRTHIEDDDDTYNGKSPVCCSIDKESVTVTPSIRRQQERDLLAHNTTAVSLETIGAAIKSSKNFASQTKLCELNLDSVLSSTSYRSIMRQTFGVDGSIGPSSVYDSDKKRNPENAAIRIPTITRAFEESYMREAHSHERECARGLKCECMYIDPSQPFVSVEFLTIEEISNPPNENQLCVVCSRKETQYLFYDMVFNRKVYNGVIQRYGNVSGANEYAAECLLRCTKSGDLSCMPKPIMSHQRNRYRVCRHPNLDILCLRQTRVSPHDHVSSASLDNPMGCMPKSQCQALSSSAVPPTNVPGIPRAGKNRGF